MKTTAVNSKNKKNQLIKVKPKLVIEYRPIATLRLNPKNPRRHNEKQIRQIARSIEVFGFNVPILINAEMQVVGGHGRLQACKLLGLTEAPTILLEHLTEAQTRGFMIADNRLTEKSVWDEHFLAEQFQVLSTLDLDFDVNVTGFEMGEIKVMIEGLAPASGSNEDSADAIPESETKPQVTQAGDVWILDRHPARLGDAQGDAVHSILIEGQRAAAVVSDPRHVDKIVRRWQKLTGLEAVHQGTGETFSRRQKEIADAQQK